MGDSTVRPRRSPDRDEAISGSDAVHVDDRRIAAWQFRVDVSDPDGTWHFVETLDRGDDPKLSLDQATLLPPRRVATGRSRRRTTVNWTASSGRNRD